MASTLSRRVFTRFKRLGLISLLTSFFGGAVLIFVGANGLLMDGVAAPKHWRFNASHHLFDSERLNYYDPYRGFRYGSHLEIQSWIAILGVGFALTSYGLGEANHHLFDWWSTWQASHGEGLNYSRYLNTQHRAPVAYGIRGFPQFTTLRYLVTGVSIATSIAYKFGIVQTEIMVHEVSLIGFRSYPISVEGTPPMMSSFKDEPYAPNTERRFVYPEEKLIKTLNHSGPDPSSHMIPPSAVLLPAAKIHSTNGGKYGLGRQTNQELAIVANLTEHRGGFNMSENHEDWNRVLVDHWFQNGSGIVDYRVYNSTQMQIQWASPGRGHDDPASNLSGAVLQRLTYEVRFVLLEAERSVRLDNGFFADLNDVDTFRILSMGREPINLGYNKTTLPTKWIDAFLAYPGHVQSEWKETGTGNSTQYYREPRLLNGVGGFVQIIMSKLPSGGCLLWGSEPALDGGLCSFDRADDSPGPPVKDPPNDAQSPLSMEAERIAFSRKPFSQYPFFTGMTTVSGCRPVFAGIFIAIGAFSVLLGFVRIYIGPPRLTSWVGQHIYLAKAGMINLDTEQLSSGYDAAPKQAGILRLEVPSGRDDKETRNEIREGGEEEMLRQETTDSE